MASPLLANTGQIQTEKEISSNLPNVDKIKNETNYEDITGVPLEGLFKVPRGADSFVSGNKVIITQSKRTQVGSIFSTEENMLDLRKDFTAEMYVKIDGSADGITFVMHNDKNSTNQYAGLEGKGLGVYASKKDNGLRDQILRSFVIEMDTYYNDGSDGPYDGKVSKNDGRGHVANSFPDREDNYSYFKNGDVYNQNHYNVQYPNFKLGDNKWRNFKIEWNSADYEYGKGGELTYQLEGLDAVTVTITRDTFDADKVYWGFTGSTGNKVESAEVLFSSVPGLIYYGDELEIVDKTNTPLTETSAVKNDTLLTVNYSGKYVTGKQELIKPKLKFNLSQGQVYQQGSFKINDQEVAPELTDNILSVEIPNFTLENNILDVSFKIKTEGLKSFDKPSINSNISGDNYKQVDGKTSKYLIDSEAPTGVGKITVIDQYDEESLTQVSDYKQFLKSWDDDITPKEKVLVYPKAGQDVKQIVSSNGPVKFTLALEDEVGNIGYLDVPLYIKAQGQLVSNNDDHLITAKSITMFNTEYPKTTEELVKRIREDSSAVLWQAEEDGTLQKLNSNLINIAVDSLPKPGSIPDEKNYEAILTYKSDNTTVKLGITLSIIQGASTVIIEFIDEAERPLKKSISLEGNIGTSIDLTKKKEVQETIQTILKENYEIVQRPENETAIPIKKEEYTIQYKFKGRLFVQHSPKFLNFGRKSLGIPFIRVDNAKYDQPLIIWDNRENPSKWTLTARLKQVLTSVEDPNQQLPSALKYKVSQTETVSLSEDIEQPITERIHGEKGQYNISDEWDKNQTGPLLETQAWKVLQPGKYRATILWQIEQAP